VLGIGTGRELPALLDAGHDVLGLDLSAAMIDECRRRSRTVRIVRADFWEPLPFPDGAFDAVLALHGTLAHPPGTTEAPFVALGRELARVLTPGGLFVAEVPAAEAIDHLGVRTTGASTFRHRDETSGVEIEGVLLRRERWPAVLGDAFETTVAPLGTVEHLVQAIRLPAPPC
jgi:SAM-dependent methyltransferase